MSKKQMYLAASAVVALVMAFPAGALANWTTEGAALGVNATIEAHGTFSFVGAIGSVDCNDATLDADMNAGTTDATVTSLTFDNPAVNCDVTGFIGTLCGTHSITGGRLAKNATAQVAGLRVLRITQFELVFEFGSCTTVTLTDLEGLNATADNHEAMHSLTLSGDLEDNLGGEEAISGELVVTPSGMYGF